MEGFRLYTSVFHDLAHEGGLHETLSDIEHDNLLFLVEHVIGLEHGVDPDREHGLTDGCFQVFRGQGALAHVAQEVHEEDVLAGHHIRDLNVDVVHTELFGDGGNDARLVFPHQRDQHVLPVHTAGDGGIFVDGELDARVARYLLNDAPEFLDRGCSLGQVHHQVDGEEPVHHILAHVHDVALDL